MNTNTHEIFEDRVIAPAIAGALPSQDLRVSMSDHVLVIKPGRSWSALDLRELFNARELLFLLAWRDISVRYKQTVLGIAWAILQPVMTMAIFSVLFGKIAKMPSDGVPYPIFAYTGLLPWTFFSNAVVNSSNSLVDSANLISKVYFPRMIIPAGAVLAGLVDFAVASAILLAMMLYYSIWPSFTMLMLVPLVALLSLTALAAGLWLSALNVKYRDVRHAVPFLIQIGMYLTPVVYPVSVIPSKWRWLLALNPVSGAIRGFRSSLLHLPFDWSAFVVSAIIAAALLVLAALSFKAMEREFADVI
jgi:lipopolysaccharide transport system permease protein